MNQKKTDSWEISFNSEFKGNLWKDDGNGNFTTCGEDVKAFIRSHFISKEELKREIKRLKMDWPDKVSKEYVRFYEMGFNEALSDLLALIKSKNQQSTDIYSGWATDGKLKKRIETGG